jgi:hypothetical protein
MASRWTLIPLPNLLNGWKCRFPPRLLQVFTDLATELKAGGISSAGIQDILEYTSFRINKK